MDDDSEIRVTAKEAIAYLICQYPDISAIELRSLLAEIGIEVSPLTVNCLSTNFKRSIREIDRLREEVRSKKKRYRQRTWYPDD